MSEDAEQGNFPGSHARRNIGSRKDSDRAANTRRTSSGCYAPIPILNVKHF